MVRVYLYTEATVGNVADRGGMERKLKKIYRPVMIGDSYG